MLSLVGLLLAAVLPAFGQFAPVAPQAQRSALSAVRSQVGWVQNATKTAANYGPQGCGNIRQAFDGLRQAYSAFKNTMNQKQLAYGANELAELDAGLDIIQEAFVNFEEDLAAGQPYGPALSNLCRIVREGSGLWLQELNKTCTRLLVGRGG